DPRRGRARARQVRARGDPARALASASVLLPGEHAHRGGDTLAKRWYGLVAHVDLVALRRADPQPHLQQQPIEDLPFLEVEVGPLEVGADRLELPVAASGSREPVLEYQIGRASCRERVGSSDVAGSVRR